MITFVGKYSYTGTIEVRPNSTQVPAPLPNSFIYVMHQRCQMCMAQSISHFRKSAVPVRSYRGPCEVILSTTQFWLTFDIFLLLRLVSILFLRQFNCVVFYVIPPLTRMPYLRFLVNIRRKLRLSSHLCNAAIFVIICSHDQ